MLILKINIQANFYFLIYTKYLSIKWQMTVFDVVSSGEHNSPGHIPSLQILVF